MGSGSGEIGGPDWIGNASDDCALSIYLFSATSIGSLNAKDEAA